MSIEVTSNQVLRWSELYPQGVDYLRTPSIAEVTVFLFPVGSSEFHGEYLPLGVKLFEADQQVLHLAKTLSQKMPEWFFIIMPLVPLSVDHVTSKYSLPVRAHVVRDALVDQVDGLKRLGFKNFAALAPQATPRQLTAIEDASSIVSSSKVQMVSLSSYGISSHQVLKSPMIGVPAEHGGKFDVCFMKVFQPHLHIKADLLASQPMTPPVVNLKRWWQFFRNQLAENWDASWVVQSNPQNLEDFMLQWEQKNSELAEVYRSVLLSERKRTIFRSPYRYFPTNGSFFRVYLLATLFFVLMLIWTLWSMKNAFEF